MSCHTSFGYNSLPGSCYSTAPSVAPAAPNHSVQFNELNQFAGDGRFVYDQTTGNLDVPTITPDTIVDQTNSDGTNGQYLTSTGTGIEWVDLPVYPTPAAPFDSVQFNDSGDFGGSSAFTFNSTTNTLAVNNIAVGEIKPTRIYDNSNSSGTSGQYLTSTGTGIDWETLPAYPTPGGANQDVQFNNSGVLGGENTFTYNSTTNTLAVENIKPTTITDDVNSVGTAGQYLTSTGVGVDWATLPSYPTPGGVSTNIQFNNAGAFGGSANFVRNLATGDVNINANLGVGSLTAPTDRLVVTGANSTVRVKSTGTNSGFVVIEDSSSGVKQLAMQVNTDTADFTSIQQGVAFRNFRFNPTQNTSSISCGTTAAWAIGGLMCSSALSNRKIILFGVANDEHQNHSLGVNTDTFRFQIPATTNRYTWNAATASNASNELMRLTGTGNLAIGTTSTNGQLQLSNSTINRKIVLYETVNNDHQFFGLGINTSVFRFQIDNTANRYSWFAGVNSTTSNEVMRLTGTGLLTLYNTLTVGNSAQIFSPQQVSVPAGTSLTVYTSVAQGMYEFSAYASVNNRYYGVFFFDGAGGVGFHVNSGNNASLFVSGSNLGVVNGSLTTQLTYFCSLRRLC